MGFGGLWIAANAAMTVGDGGLWIAAFAAMTGFFGGFLVGEGFFFVYGRCVFWGVVAAFGGVLVGGRGVFVAGGGGVCCWGCGHWRS